MKAGPLDYATWLECARAYAKARGLQELEPHAEQERQHREGSSPATYVERAFESALRKGFGPEAG